MPADRSQRQPSRTDPDGYTIFLGSSSIHLTEMILRTKPLLDPRLQKELATVSMVAITAFAIFIRRYRAKPQGTDPYIEPAASCLTDRLAPALIISAANVAAGITDLPHVPYHDAGPAADVIGGQIPIIPAMTGQVLGSTAPASCGCWRPQARHGCRSRRKYRPRSGEFPAWWRSRCWAYSRRLRAEGDHYQIAAANHAAMTDTAYRNR